MKRAVSVVMVVLVLFTFFACSGDPSPTVVHEGESVKLIRTMMALDYASMSVAEFNETIQTMCTDAGTTVFEVISAAYDHFFVSDDSGEFMYFLFTDPELEAFMETTLEYSAQEIFGEPVHQKTVFYMTMPGMSAADMSKKHEQMRPDEWAQYVEENLADIRTLAVLLYTIEADIPNPESITVAERDAKINDTHATIQDSFLRMSPEAVLDDSLEPTLSAMFETLSAVYSDDKMSVGCQILSLERDE